jgi:hypothetical protein
VTFRSLLGLGLALFVAASVAPASARDICATLEPASYVLVFKGVKKLRPGRAVPLTGIGIISATGVVPLQGTAIADSSGSIEIGVTGYGMADGIGNVMIHAAVDADFTGPAQLDIDGDFAPDALPASLVGLDCRTVAIP